MNSFRIDHDYHIHSQLSLCSGDPEQTAVRILQYGQANGLAELCLTDHFWDETVSGASPWYEQQDFVHVSRSLPLPQAEGTRLFFGCEIDMDRRFRVGISRDVLDRFDFVIIPTTHLHMTGFTIAEEDGGLERRAELYVERLRALLAMDLPFAKIGIAHLTCPLLAPGTFADHLAVLNRISDAALADVYGMIAQQGAGFELNFQIGKYSGPDLQDILRPYRIAKRCGCRFYLGSDAHHPRELDAAYNNFRAIVQALELTENDRFRFCQ